MWKTTISSFALCVYSDRLDVLQKDKDGRMYYTFEFASKASNYIRHALAVVTVANGKASTTHKEATVMHTQICQAMAVLWGLSQLPCKSSSHKSMSLATQ